MTMPSDTPNNTDQPQSEAPAPTRQKIAVIDGGPAERIIEVLRYIAALQPQDAMADRILDKDLLLDPCLASELPGLSFPAKDETGEAWVRLERIQPTQAIDVPETLVAWVIEEDEISKPPKMPTLRKRIDNPVAPVKVAKRRRKNKEVDDIPLATPEAGDVEDNDGDVDVDMAEGGVSPYLWLRNFPDIEKRFEEWMVEWRAWASEETLRRRSAMVYERLYRVFRDQVAEGDQREIVCGAAHVVWKRKSGDESITYSYPLILQRCEVRMVDGAGAALEIMQGASPSTLHLGRLGQGIGGEAAEAFWQTHTEQNVINPFDPDSYAVLVEGLAARLDASGTFLPGWKDTALPDASERLTVLPWMSFFQKTRSQSHLLNDLIKLETSIRNTDTIPDILVNLVDRDSVNMLSDKLPRFRGLESFARTDAGEITEDLYFPLPYNEEQVQVAQRLAVSPGVVVQGPPGTGKSHTIANIVSHYLAHGKRVLVTAHSAAALAAVREKIPEDIRDLTAALLTSDTESLSDFEKSVREIADRLATFQPAASERTIEALTSSVEGLYGRLSEIDGVLEDRMKAHHAIHEINGQQATLMDLARFHSTVSVDMPGWLGRVPKASANNHTRDGGVAFPTRPEGMDNSVIQTLRQARLDAGPYFSRIFEPIADPANWPKEDELRNAIKAQRRLDILRKQAQEGQVAAKASATANTAVWNLTEHSDGKIQDLMGLLEKADALDTEVRAPDYNKIKTHHGDIPQGEGRQARETAGELCNQMVALRDLLRQQLGHIQLPAGALKNVEYRQAVSRGAMGEPPLGGFFQRMKASKPLTDLVNNTRVDGVDAKNKESWILVNEHLLTLDRATQAQSDWARTSVAFGWTSDGKSLIPSNGKDQDTPETLFQMVSHIAREADLQLARDNWQHHMAPAIEDLMSHIFIDPTQSNTTVQEKSKWGRDVTDRPPPISLRARGGVEQKTDTPTRRRAPWGDWDERTDQEREVILAVAERSLNLWRAIKEEELFLATFKTQIQRLVEDVAPQAQMPDLPALPIPPRTRQAVAVATPTMMDLVRQFLDTELWKDTTGTRQTGDTLWRGKTLVSSADSAETRVAKWRTLLAGAERLFAATQLAAKPTADAMNTMVNTGFGDWVHALIKQPLQNLPNPNRGAVIITEDPLLPDHWQDLVTAAQVQAFLVHLDAPQELMTLLATRRTVVLSLANNLRELSAEKAWAALSKTATSRQRQALGAYLSAVRAVGSGNGKRSGRHQQDARAAMAEAFGVVPCWIMPTSRVSESMPSEIALFDLVIVDEASQSDISALPALMRGKKVLVVGDDKQVSPSNFVQEDTILQQRRTLLANQPFAPLMAPDKSLYDLFSGILPNASIMLREHFRCVEPIIAWSNTHYYHDKMVPLRMPSAVERMDPPLLDILVEDGKLEDDINAGEAIVIAREVARLIEDPAMANKTIGVVTLPSKDSQAQHIKEAIDQAIPHTAYLHHKILVGPPARFQGSERDIMFVAMTWDGSSVGATDKPEFHQRFNVAMSRARDQMILVRSVANANLKGGSLMSDVVQHFRTDTGQGSNERHGSDRCQTDLERDVFVALERLGYDVQARVGPRHARIDLVVEGADGQRLAVECDGDLPATTLSHGDTWKTLWQATTARQRVLERAGWTFFRITAAAWYLDPQGTLAKAVAALTAAGVSKKGEHMTSKSARQFRTTRAFDIPAQEDKVAANVVTGRFARRVVMTVEAKG